MSHSIKSGIITFEGKKYRLDKDDRLAAQAASLSQIARRNPVATFEGISTASIDQSGYLCQISRSSSGTTVCELQLPPVAASGVQFDFVFGDVLENKITASSADGAIIVGSVITAAGAEAASGSFITGSNQILQSAGAPGDQISFVSDGTNWHVKGFFQADVTLSS